MGHHNMPGLGNRYFATEVLAPLAQKLASKGCELRFATVLRDAVEHVKSAAFFGRVRNRRQMERYGPRNANPMTKYVSYNFQSQWPTGFKWFPNPDGVDEKLRQHGLPLCGLVPTSPVDGPRSRVV